MNFMQKCVAGLVADPLRSIDDEVAKWHNRPDVSDQLHEFLGMTWEEYALWAPNPKELTTIIEERRKARRCK